MPQSQRNKITQARLKELLDYDPATGIFRWRLIGNGKGRPAPGKRAGCIKPGTRWDGGGYRVIRLDYRLYRTAHLAWLFVYGAWPKDILDHRDLDRAHDAIANLREANHSQNNINGRAHAHNRLGIRGVGFDETRGKYRAYLMKDGKHVLQARFDTLEEAVAARAAACKMHFGEFARLDG